MTQSAPTAPPLPAEQGVPIMDIAEFRARYPAWLDTVRPLLEAKNWKDAFLTYPFPVHDQAPWTPMTRPLAECRVAMLSTAGLYVKDDQPRFKAEHIEGDWTLRELADEVPLAALDIAHTHYDNARAREDVNCVYPLERLRELAAAGVIGGLATRHYSISGYCTRADWITERTAPQVVERLQADRVDVLLHIPV